MASVRHMPLRHELKYNITPQELSVLRGILRPLLRGDPNGDAKNEYVIRSLYFDTFDDQALTEKIAGVDIRRKYRIRI